MTSCRCGCAVRSRARRRPELGSAAATCFVRTRKPVLRYAGAKRRHGEPAGAGRARHNAERSHLGDARRRHAARHRAAARQGRHRLVSCHRRHAVVDLPLSGSFVDMLKRIVSLAGSMATADPNAPGSGRAGAREVVPPTRILDGFGVFGPPPPNARPVPVGFTGRGTAENPPGSMDRRKACWRLMHWRRPTGLRPSTFPRSMRAGRSIE